MDKIKRLLEKGFFPSQLPPPFSTRTLSKQYAALIPTWPIGLQRLPSSRGEHFSVARAGHLRRAITIPNPANQVFLAQAVSSNWSALQAHFKKSKLSLSRPIFKNKTNRATEITPLSELAEKRLLLSSSYRFFLKTDISRFFPTLYTHSIPWALHGKVAAKSNQRNVTAAFFGNVLDQLVQRSQERQTIGIPIGPDTSHIVSEIIATSIDILIREQLGSWPTGYRHVDDYFLCFNTRAEAEHALTCVVRALREFELDINPSKTQIVEAESSHEDEWVETLKQFEIADEEKQQKKDIHRFFAYALGVAKTNEDALKYALRRSSSKLILSSNWPVYEAYILRVGSVAPNCLQNVTQILTTYAALGYSMSLSKVKNFCSNVIIAGAKAQHHSEVAWALWLAKELNLKLPRSITAELGEMQSAICALIALDLRESGLLVGELDTAAWNAALQESGLRGPMWLLAYEASNKGWLQDIAPGFIAGDDYFGPMKAKDVLFYDETRRISPLIKRTRKSLLQDFLEEGDEYEFSDERDEYVA